MGVAGESKGTCEISIDTKKTIWFVVCWRRKSAVCPVDVARNWSCSDCERSMGPCCVLEERNRCVGGKVEDSNGAFCCIKSEFCHDR